MDGFGIAEPVPTNAIFNSKTPVLDDLFKSCPNTQLQASGEDVGLPEGQIGNSEVGHTNIGAGRVVFQVLPKITNAIKTGKFFENEAYIAAMDAVKENGGALHIFGLMSNGGVHSHNSHIWGILEMAHRRGLEKVYVHCFMDGRDVPPRSGKAFIEECVAKCNEIGTGKIATISGRFYAMDRDNRWERVSEAYAALVYGEGVYNTDPVDAMQKSYDNDVSDEFVKPIVCDKDGMIKDGDSVIFMNFRPDRAREITRTFVDPDFNGFERKNGFFHVNYVCTTQYDETMPNVTVAYPPEALVNTFGEVMSKNGKTQLRIAETEKYAHVTFFFNGGVEAVNEGEDRILVPSPKVSTYDLQPEMSAPEVTDKLVDAILSDKYNVVIVNFANCDMVGHTGVFDAAVKAVETVDESLGRLREAVEKMGGVILLTADHGNADKMYEPDGSAFTAHTTNPVPFTVIGMGDVKLREGGRLCDLSPTILKVLGLPQPSEMTGESLIVD